MLMFLLVVFGGTALLIGLTLFVCELCTFD